MIVLPAPGVIGQQEPERLPRQHFLVDGGDLVGQRLDQRGVDGQEGVEEVGEPDPVGLGDEPKKCPVAVEAPGLAVRCHGERRFAVAIDQLVAEPSRGVLVSDLDGDRADPLDGENRDQSVRQDAARSSSRA